MDPLREEAYQQLMLILALSGRRSEALAQYDTCCRVLAETLGIEPEAETRALYERIRDGELGKEAREQRRKGEPLSPALPLPRPPAWPSPSSSAPFVARERELAQLDGFLELALAGRGRVVFVTGGAGRGKTALIQEFARRAQARHGDLITAGGHCNAHLGTGDPYLPFREILVLLTGDIEARWRAGTISREYAHRLWTLAPHSIQAMVDTGPALIDSFISGPALVNRATTMVQGADDAERVYLHEAVGKTLEQLHEPRPEEAALELARHFQAAGLVEKAVEYLRLAGERARRLSAHQEAITHLNND